MQRAIGTMISLTLLVTSVLLTAVPTAHSQSQQPPIEALLTQDPQASTILVFAFPSSSYLDWSSPSGLARSSVLSTLTKRLMGHPSTIGHAQIAWRCQKPDGSWEAGATGQTGENNNQSLKALFAGWGMSLLELVYTDGYLETEAEVAQRIHTGAYHNQFSWLGLKVPPENCLKLADYVKSYGQSGAALNYGFPVDPLRLQGGGCTSFANAALERSGLNLPFRSAWLRNYQIPEALMGRSEAPPEYSTEVPQSRIPKRLKQVSLADILFGDLRWAQPGEPAVDFFYYDPELFYESFLHLENALRKQRLKALKPARRTVTEDAFQQRLRLSMESWFESLKKAGHDMYLQEIAGVSGPVIDLRATANSGADSPSNLSK